MALRIDPEFARAEYMLGVALAGRGRLDEANDRNQRALRDDPDGAETSKTIRGLAVAEGIVHYKQTLMIDPQLTLGRNNLGITPRDADRLDEAIGHYEKAIRMEPGLSVAHAALGQALRGPGAIPRGRAATRRCLDRLPQGHELRSNVLAQLRALRATDRLAGSAFRGPPGEGQARRRVRVSRVRRALRPPGPTGRRGTPVRRGPGRVTATGR